MNHMTEVTSVALGCNELTGQFQVNLDGIIKILTTQSGIRVQLPWEQNTVLPWLLQRLTQSQFIINAPSSKTIINWGHPNSESYMIYSSIVMILKQFILEYTIKAWQAPKWMIINSKVIWGYCFICHGGRHQVAIFGATILVPYHVVKSLQLIWRPGTRRFHLRVPGLQMSCRDLT